jgi:hypothetical protein
MRRNSRSAAARVQERVDHSGRGSDREAEPPLWVKPQLTELVKQPPDGPDWFQEIKYDGYRMHARIDDGGIRLLTQPEPVDGLDHLGLAGLLHDSLDAGSAVSPSSRTGRSG